uniref:hypothetical protein n=1 Tax=Bradyrhizobium sp. (strain ORS 278) TaxID=114615 RepID=UPI0002FF2FEC|nr:hypothetical protein [Bradyrhizobium sp. ORS 278]
MRRIRYCNRLPGRASRVPPRPAIAGFISTALVPPRAALGTEAAIIAQMAEDMREGAASGGGITENDLISRGYTAAQVKLHAGNARALAQRLAGPAL